MPPFKPLLTLQGGVSEKEVKLISKFIMDIIENIPSEEYLSSCVYTLGVGNPDFSSDKLKKNIECYLSSGSFLFFKHFLEGGTIQSLTQEKLRQMSLGIAKIAGCYLKILFKDGIVIGAYICESNNIKRRMYEQWNCQGTI